MNKQLSRNVLLLALVAFPLWTASPSAAEVLLTSPSGAPAWVRGELGVVELPDREIQDPEEYFEQLHGMLGAGVTAALSEHMEATGEETVEIAEMHVDNAEIAHVSFRQQMSGLPVVGTGFRAHVDLSSGVIQGLNGLFYPDREDYDLDVYEPMAFEDALARALAEQRLQGEALEPAELVFLAGGEQLELAYRAVVGTSSGAGPERFFIRATDGRLLSSEPILIPNVPPPGPGSDTEIPYPMTKQWFRTYTATAISALPPYDWWQLCELKIAFPLPGFLMVPTGPCSTDASASRAHASAIDVFRYYREEHGLSSYDGSYAPLESVVHYRVQDAFGNWPPLNNAFWDTQENRMYYGDGDGNILLDLTLGFDVAAHELTHGVTRAHSNLIYAKESGALNEAISDIFAAAVEAWADGGISADTWMLGEDVAGPTLGAALRYMDNPTLDGYSPDYYPERLYPDPGCVPVSSNDRCGVHGNSGIANLAFYLLVTGGSHPTGKTSTVVPGIGMEQAAAIFFAANQSYLTPGDGFAAARLATEQAALALFGSAAASSVSASWDAVGVP